MNAPRPSTNPDGPEGLVLALIETLREEEAVLGRLGAQFGRQLDALREQQPEAHEHAMHAAGEAVGALGGLRARRERQVRLLGRILKIDAEAVSLQQLADACEGRAGLSAFGPRLLEARAAVRRQAEHTRQVCEQLEFALQYAVSLGREMLQAMQDLDVPPPTRVYTATGATSQPARRRPFVNKMG